MRKISVLACKAFYDRRNFKSDNTRVSLSLSGKPRLFLWGNCIAWIGDDDRIWFNLCGWNTATTKERLRTLGINLRSRNGDVWLDNTRLIDTQDYNSNRCLNQRPEWLR